MRRYVCAALLLCVLLSFTGCSGGSYALKKSAEQIESIDIVWAESSLNYTVSKTLSDTERAAFLERFQSIKFYRYLVGEAMPVCGEAVNITSQSGDYEMICALEAEYVKDGKVSSIRKSCDEQELHTLLDSFLG